MTVARSPGEHADVEALKARLYAALKHEKSCTCGECSGGLNAVDALIAVLARLEERLATAERDLGYITRAALAVTHTGQRNRECEQVEAMLRVTKPVGPDRFAG